MAEQERAEEKECVRKLRQEARDDRETKVRRLCELWREHRNIGSQIEQIDKLADELLPPPPITVASPIYGFTDENGIVLNATNSLPDAERYAYVNRGRVVRLVEKSELSPAAPAAAPERERIERWGLFYTNGELIGWYDGIPPIPPADYSRRHGDAANGRVFAHLVELKVGERIVGGVDEPCAWHVVSVGGVLCKALTNEMSAKEFVAEQWDKADLRIVPVYLHPAERVGVHPLIASAARMLFYVPILAVEAAKLREEIRDAGGLDKLLAGEQTK